MGKLKEVYSTYRPIKEQATSCMDVFDDNSEQVNDEDNWFKLPYQ